MEEIDGVREIDEMKDVLTREGDGDTNLNRERNQNGDGTKTGNHRGGIERDGVTAQTVRNDQIDRTGNTVIDTVTSGGTGAVGAGTDGRNRRRVGENHVIDRMWLRMCVRRKGRR